MAGGLKAVGEAVAALRYQRGWTQAQLSERSAVSIATIRSTERADGMRSRRTLEDISVALGMPKNHLSEVLAGHQPPGETSEQVTTEPWFLNKVDEILMKRLMELVVPHLNQIERQLNTQASGSSGSVGAGAKSAHEDNNR